MELKKTRIESDLLGELEVPSEALYGVQTQRALNNYRISTMRMCDYPDYVKAIAYVKLAAIQANSQLGCVPADVAEAVSQACREVIAGQWHEHFPTDMIQGGAGTSVNMNANEVLANRALEIMGYERGDYQHCWPNDHLNYAQSTNDVYPTAVKLGLILMTKHLIGSLQHLIGALRDKGDEFADVIKMGRTQLQDAVPMTVGQEFHAFANTLSDEFRHIEQAVDELRVTNMGGTAIGTGLNAEPGFTELCTKLLSEYSGEALSVAPDLIASTSDTGAYTGYSSAMKRLAIKLSKMCNDLRLMASGPCCGLHEINLPPKAPGSSIMPGKVNPVIPEVTNQVCFKVIGNDTTVMMAAEAGQLQLNVMEPVIMQCLTEDITWLTRVMDTLVEQCIKGITVNAEHNAAMVRNSIGIVTALNPYIGYKHSTALAKEAQQTGRSIYDLVLEKQIMSKEKLDEILDPKHMLKAQDTIK